MANSGIYHIVEAVPVPRSKYEDQGHHALSSGTSFPASPVEKQLFYRTDLHKLYIYNGTGWVDTTLGTDFTAHASRHQDGGADEINIAALNGEPAELTTHKDKITGVHGVTLANIAGSSVASLDVASHKSRHQIGGADELSIDRLFFRDLLPFYYKQWDDLVGHTAGKSGTGTAPVAGYRLSLTVAANNDTSYIYGSRYWMAYPWFSIGDFGSDNFAGCTCWVGWYTNPTAPTDTERHIGFKIINGRLWASQANGTTQTIEDTGIDLATYTGIKLHFIKLGNSTYFYHQSVLVKTLGAVTINEFVYPTFHLKQTSTTGRNVGFGPYMHMT